MAETNLKNRTQEFALAVLKYLETLPKGNPFMAISNQLTRCATSVGANYRAALRGKSSADFIYKLKIVEEECDETMYFLELLMRLREEDGAVLKALHKEANELLSITVASIKTARKNQK